MDRAEEKKCKRECISRDQSDKIERHVVVFCSVKKHIGQIFGTLIIGFRSFS